METHNVLSIPAQLFWRFLAIPVGCRNVQGLVMTSLLQAPSGAVMKEEANAAEMLGSALSVMATEAAGFFEEVNEAGDPVEAYFECITTCSLDDGECITECTEILRQGA
jgi:hypothetical protein